MSMLALKFFLLGSLAESPSVLDQLKAVISGEPVVETVELTDVRRLVEDEGETLPPTELTLEENENIPEEERRRAISRDKHGNTWASLCQPNGCCRQEIKCVSGRSAWRSCCGCRGKPRWPSLTCRGGSGPSPSPTTCPPSASSSLDRNGNTVKREVKRNCCVTITVSDRRGTWRSNTGCGEEPRTPTLPSKLPWNPLRILGRRLEDDEAEDQATELQAPVAEVDQVRRAEQNADWNQVQYQMIYHGNCRGQGMQPVNTKHECERAARHLGLSDQWAQENWRDAHRPEGCYWYKGSQLWFASNWGTQGRGAETGHGWKTRHPICKRRTVTYNCVEGWGAADPRFWSQEKRRWCCNNQGRGCGFGGLQEDDDAAPQFAAAPPSASELDNEEFDEEDSEDSNNFDTEDLDDEDLDEQEFDDEDFESSE